MTEPLLLVDGVSAGYDGALALRDVTLMARPGELVALIGSSGAGKTTLLSAISGVRPVRRGAVWLGGRPSRVRLDRLRPYRIAALGLTAVPEGRRLFDRLTVRENLLMGAYLPAARTRAGATLDELERLFPVLAERREVPAGALSGGEQQLVALARGLMARPRCLLLDDPFLGLAGAARARLGTVLRELTDARGLTILAAGQHVRTLLRLAHRGYLLDEGRVVAEGSATSLAANVRVRQTLLELAPASGAVGLAGPGEPA